MRRAGNLFERVVAFDALCASARRAAKGKRLSRDASRFLLDLEPQVLAIQRELLDGRYQPGPYRTFVITDPKRRTISAAPFRDRVVHHALCAALEPVLERYAIFDSYACRRGKGTLAAVRRAQHHARRHARFLKLDVLHFFETADHGILKALLRRLVKDARLLDLVDRFVDLGAPGSPSGQGLPIGNLTSQHFANLYLGPLDHFVKDALRAPAYCRYMDDLLLFDDDEGRLRRTRQAVTHFLEESLNLRLRDPATLSGPVRIGVPFLGFRIWPGLVRLDRARARRFRRHVRARTRELTRGIIDSAAFHDSVGSLIAWAEQADTRGFRTSFFQRLERTGMLAD